MASDSTHMGAFDENVFTEWHSRYGGRGVRIYWHIETGSVVAIRTGRAHAPERGGLPVADDAAVELHLPETGAHVVILEVAVDAPDREGAAARHQAVSLPVRQVVEPTDRAFGHVTDVKTWCLLIRKGLLGKFSESSYFEIVEVPPPGIQVGFRVFTRGFSPRREGSRHS